jgi:hypothetical protein
MKDNNFLLVNLERCAKQVQRHYDRLGMVDKITSITFHMDDGCPCLNVEFDAIDLIAFWHWQKATDEKGETIIGRDDIPFNRWQLHKQDKLSAYMDEEQEQEKEELELEPV